MRNGKDIEEINLCTRQVYKPEGVYTFSLVLCDNEDFTLISNEGGRGMPDSMKLFPHQEQALGLTKNFNRCAYYLDMGLGKTFVGAEKLMQLNSRINLVIVQKSKVQDWIDHLVENYAMNHCWMIYNLTDKKEFQWFIAAIEDGNPTPICGVINYELSCASMG